MDDINNRLVSLIRKNIQSLKPYSSAKDEFDGYGNKNIWLDANENSLGSVLEKPINRYPDHLQDELKKKISKIKKTSRDQIFLGNGSDEAIDLLIRVFCEPGQDGILLMPPTYGMYEVCAAVNDVRINEVPLLENFDIDLDSVLSNLRSDIKLIFICSPNNPSGNCFTYSSIETISKAFDGIVIIDEAYIDFCPTESWLPLLDQYDNLVVLQTFSKAWGMANLRIGMAFADPLIVRTLNKIKYPYNISGPSQKIALSALDNYQLMRDMTKQMINNRQHLIDCLISLPVVIKVYPSETNFILVKVTDAAVIYNYLVLNNIIVRDRSKMTHCGNCLRITVGTEDENSKLINALRDYQ